jgi:singapore isolate B (sub-type 7) whole genome shotgun sequence assembly, scaffold_16
MNNYGDVLFDRVMEVLTQFGVIRDGHVVGLSSVNREKSLLEMNLLVNKDFEFSMVSMRVECNE